MKIIIEKENNPIDIISTEIISILVNLAKGVIGNNVGGVILREMEINDFTNAKEIIYKFSSTVENIIGKNGAFATLRQIGRDLATKILEENPKHEWSLLFNNAMNEFGFANMIKHRDGSTFMCNCVFYNVLQKEGLEPTEHPVCWAGWGFVEGFMKEFENIQRIIWVGRDNDAKICKFDFIRNNEDLTIDSIRTID